MKRNTSHKATVIGLILLLLFPVLKVNGQEQPADSLKGFDLFWEKADTLIILLAKELDPDLMEEFTPGEVRYDSNLKSDLVDELRNQIGTSRGMDSKIFLLVDSLEKRKQTYRGDRRNNPILLENVNGSLDDLFTDAENIVKHYFPNQGNPFIINDIKKHPAFGEFSFIQNDIKIGSDSGTEVSPIKAKESFFSLNNIVLLVLLLLIIVLFFLFLKTSGKIKELNNDHRIWRSKNESRFSDLEARINAIKANNESRYSGLDKQFQTVNDRFDNIQGQIALLRKNNQGGVIERPEPNQPEPKPAPTTISYFMPNADQGGFFWDDKKTTYQENGSVFQLEVDPKNPNLASFKLLVENEKVVKNAVTNPSYLKPVCQIENIDAGGRNIAIIKHGQLRLNQDKWVIADGNKLMIKFF